MTESQRIVARPSRRRLVLLWPAVAFLAVVWFCLNDTTSIVLTYAAVVTVAIGLPPDRERWRLIVGWIGVASICAALITILWSSSEWVGGHSGWWLLSVLAIMATLGLFGLQLLSTLFFTKVNSVSKGSFVVALQYGAIGLAMSMALFASSLNAPLRVHYFVEQFALQNTSMQVTERCLDGSTKAPFWHNKPITAWSCENGVTRFTVDRWGGYFNGGEWGFAKSKGKPTWPIPESSTQPTQSLTVRQIGPDWWVWKSTTWVD
jgi:hypothetical protein